MNYEEEGNQIYSLIIRNLERHLDGKECILELKEANYQWKQMEWIGWYIEYKLKKILFNHLGGEDGPKFGNTQFDYFKENPWDFKAHIVNSSSHPWIILNDCEAVDLCSEKYNGIGYFIVSGKAVYDDDGSFKEWHSKLKGKTSDYVKQRIKRGAKSRMRKKAFVIENYSLLWLNKQLFSDGISEGWIA